MKPCASGECHMRYVTLKQVSGAPRMPEPKHAEACRPFGAAPFRPYAYA